MTTLFRFYSCLVRPVASIAVFAFMFLTLPVSARGDSVYTYTESAPYAQCQGAYAVPGTYSSITGTSQCIQPIVLTISFTTSLTGTQIDNLSGEYISSTVTAFEFSDSAPGSIGFVDINQNTPNSTIVALLSTDSSGLPTAWAVSDNVSNFDGASQTRLCTEFNQGLNCTNAADNITYLDGGPNYTVGWNYQPGTWTVTTTGVATPEPSTVFMLGGGLGLLCLCWLRRRQEC